MASSSTQFLQVPKVLPGRRVGRSSSRSRQRARQGPEVPAVAEVVVSPRFRPQSPPMPGASAVDLQRRPTPPVNGYMRDLSLTNGHSESSASNIPAAMPSIEMEDARASEQTGTNYDDLNEGLYTLEQCVTPPPEIPLRQRLIGTWKLESYTAYPTPNSNIQRPTYPMTKNVTGFIMYTPDGYMSAQFLIPGQAAFQRGTGDQAQWAEAGKRFFAYSGPYYISDEGFGRQEVLRHTFQVCNLPGWIGDIQIRTHRFEENGEVLVLGSVEPTEINGDRRVPVLKWRRARNNSNGVPPPPTPQIKISGPGEP